LSPLRAVDSPCRDSAICIDLRYRSGGGVGVSGKREADSVHDSTCIARKCSMVLVVLVVLTVSLVTHPTSL
jgi:hypothetical protein